MKGKRIMNYIPIAIVIIHACVSVYFMYLDSNQSMRENFFNLPVFMQKIIPVLYVGSILILPVLPQIRMELSSYITIPIGIVFSVVGWSFIFAALYQFGNIPSLRKKSNLITSGIFKIVRHPIYAGTLMAVFGWMILWKSLILMLYFPVLFLFYLIWHYVEEKILQEEYGEEYTTYQKEVTKRIIPFVY